MEFSWVPPETGESSLAEGFTRRVARPGVCERTQGGSQRECVKIGDLHVRGSTCQGHRANGLSSAGSVRPRMAMG